MFDAGAIVGKMILDLDKWDLGVRRVKDDTKSIEGAILRNESRLRRLGVAFGIAGAAITAVNVKLIQMAATAE